MHEDWFPTAELRFVKREEVPHDGVSSSRKILQQKWRRYPQGEGMNDEWRDVPLMEEQ